MRKFIKTVTVSGSFFFQNLFSLSLSLSLSQHRPCHSRCLLREEFIKFSQFCIHAGAWLASLLLNQDLSCLFHVFRSAKSHPGNLHLILFDHYTWCACLLMMHIFRPYMHYLINGDNKWGRQGAFPCFSGVMFPISDIVFALPNVSSYEPITCMGVSIAFYWNVIECWSSHDAIIAEMWTHVSKSMAISFTFPVYYSSQGHKAKQHTLQACIKSDLSSFWIMYSWKKTTAICNCLRLHADSSLRKLWLEWLPFQYECTVCSSWKLDVTVTVASSSLWKCTTVFNINNNERGLLCNILAY